MCCSDNSFLHRIQVSGSHGPSSVCMWSGGPGEQPLLICNVCGERKGVGDDGVFIQMRSSVVAYGGAGLDITLMSPTD